MTTRAMRPRFQAPSTRKDFFSSISAAKKPTTDHSTTHTDRKAALSDQEKNREVAMPKERPTQKVTPHWKMGRTTRKETTSPADSTCRRR